MIDMFICHDFKRPTAKRSYYIIKYVAGMQESGHDVIIYSEVKHTSFTFINPL